MTVIVPQDSGTAGGAAGGGKGATQLQGTPKGKDGASKVSKQGHVVIVCIATAPLSLMHILTTKQIF